MSNILSPHPQTVPPEWPSLAKDWLNSSISPEKILSVAQKPLENTRNLATSIFNKMQNKVLTTQIQPLTLQIQSTCTDVEQIFNIAGCIPLLGTLSGTLRILFGKAQLISGIALAAISETGLFIANISKSDSMLTSKWSDLSKLGMELTLHGCLNVIRGTGESLVGRYTMGLGNVMLIIPNLTNERNFSPYFPYGSIIHNLNSVNKENDSTLKVNA